MSNTVPDGWSSAELSRFCDVVGGGTPDRSVSEYWDGDISWASPTEITSRTSKYISETKERITQLGLEKSSAKLHPAGTVLMTSRASIGYVAINTVPMATNQGFQSLRCKDGAMADYMYQYITWIRPELEKMSAGSTFSEISSSSVKKLRTTLPPLLEQQKIATILSSVDNVIETTRAQIDKLKDLKTGMMQELLIKGIGSDSVPHTEFKDSSLGRIPAEWEVKKLGEIFPKIVVGYVGNVNDHYCDKENGVPFYRTLNIRDGFIRHMPVKYVTREFNNKNGKSQIYNDDILIARVGANLGMTCKVSGLKTTANIANAIIIKSVKWASSDFFMEYIRSDHAQCQIMSEAAGGAQGVFNTKLAEGLVVPVPPLEEQIRIGQKLIKLDEFIYVSEQKLARFVSIKKALMQDLLIGKVRVNVDENEKEPAVA